MTKILIVDDDRDIRNILRDILVSCGYQVEEAYNGKMALELIAIDQFDLILLDVMMPDMDGWSVLREIRSRDYIPVIMLTARNLENDEVFGFELGADEYITKPFRKAILLARIKAVLKRNNQSEKEYEYTIGALKIDTNAVYVSNNGEQVKLSSTEYELLVYLVVNAGVALSREQLLDKVWGIDYFGGTRTVDTHIKRLRKKLGPASEFIHTVRGHGYRFVGDFNEHK